MRIPSSVAAITSHALLICMPGILVACATPKAPYQSSSEKLQSIRIAKEQLSGTPKEIVAQLNKLSKKYDFPSHTGVRIRFDSEVDSEPCGSTIFLEGKPLQEWLEQVCGSCDSRYEVVEDVIIIKLLPL